MAEEEASVTKAVKGAFAGMFECHVKNLVEFVDKKGVPQRKE